MDFKPIAPTLIVFPNGFTRISEFVFPHPEGVCFVDLWWDRPEAHPFHVLSGQIEVTGPDTWRVGDVLIRPLVKGDQEWDAWEDWLDYRQEGGAHLTDDMALKAIKAEGGIINQD